MKKITLAITLMLLSSIVFGQFEFNGYQVPAPKVHAGDVRTIDTLDQYLLRSTAFYIYSAGTYGYVTPSNSFSQASGMHYSFAGSAQVTQILFIFGKKVVVTGADTHTAAIYTCGADSIAAGTALATGTFTSDNADTAGNYTTVTFATPPTVTGNFVVAVSGMSTTNNDTLVLLCNNNGDGLGERRLEVKMVAAYGGAWVKAATVFSTLNADAMMIPVLNITTGIPVTSSDLTVSGFYPNPAVSNANINFSLTKETKVSIRIFDITGKIYSQTSEVMTEGNHTYAIDLNNMANGSYYYTISTTEGQLTSKFEVVK
jgi:hypothetical protein